MEALSDASRAKSGAHTCIRNRELRRVAPRGDWNKPWRLPVRDSTGDVWWKFLCIDDVEQQRACRLNRASGRRGRVSDLTDILDQADRDYSSDYYWSYRQFPLASLPRDRVRFPQRQLPLLEAEVRIGGPVLGDPPIVVEHTHAPP